MKIIALAGFFLLVVILISGCSGRMSNGRAPGMGSNGAQTQINGKESMQRIAVPLERRWSMKGIWVGALAVLLLAVLGCSGKFWGGTATGVLGTGAGYEYKADREMNRINEALEEGLMTEEEYEIRKDQIQRMSVVQ